MTYFLLRDFIILPKKELHWSLGYIWARDFWKLPMCLIGTILVHDVWPKSCGSWGPCGLGQAQLCRAFVEDHKNMHIYYLASMLNMTLLSMIWIVPCSSNHTRDAG